MPLKSSPSSTGRSEVLLLLCLILGLLSSICVEAANGRDDPLKIAIQRRQTTKHDILRRSARRPRGLTPRSSILPCLGTGVRDSYGNCCSSSDIHSIGENIICCDTTTGTVIYEITGDLQCCPNSQVYTPQLRGLEACCQGVLYGDPESCCATTYGAPTSDSQCCASANICAPAGSSSTSCCPDGQQYIDYNGNNACCQGQFPPKE